MKIAFDATALYGRFGGIENALWQQFHALAQLPSLHEFHVFVPRDAPDFGPYSRWHWRRLPFEGTRKLRRIAWQQLELPLLLAREKFDLLHAWNYVAPLRCPIPFVLTVQDLIALDAPRFALPANRIHYRAIMPQALQNAARVLTTTPRGKAAVLRRAPHADCRVVALGVEPLFFEPISPKMRQRVREKYGLPPQFLLFVGNFEPKKNLIGLLRSLALLPDAPPLVIAGGIKPWPAVEAHLGGVKKLGFVPREELPVLMGECSAFCFPSLCEGFGLPVLEALAGGARVVASSAVPLPNLESVAQVPNPRFPRSIASAIESALSQPASDAGRDYAREFSWPKTAQQTLSIYEEFSL